MWAFPRAVSVPNSHCGLLEDLMKCTLISGILPHFCPEGESAQLWTQNSENDPLVSISPISGTQRCKPHVFRGQQTITYWGFPIFVVWTSPLQMCSTLSHFDNLTSTPRLHSLLARVGQRGEIVAWIGITSGFGENRRLRNPGHLMTRNF